MTSFGSVDMKESGLYDNIQYADGTKENKNTRALDGPLSPPPSRENTNSDKKQSNGTAQINGPPQSSGDSGKSGIEDEGEKKKGFLRKLF